MEIHETALKILTCEGIAVNSVTWDFYPKKRRGQIISTCTWSDYTCTDPKDSHYKVTRPLYNTSVLTIEQKHKTPIAGIVRCGELDGEHSSPLSCKARVVRKYDNRKPAE